MLFGPGRPGFVRNISVDISVDTFRIQTRSLEVPLEIGADVSLVDLPDRAGRSSMLADLS